jgi:hypothetical protein
MSQWSLPAAGEAQQAFGFMYMSAPAVNEITTGGTYEKVLGTTTAGTLRDFTHTDNRLTYTGATTRQFSVDVSVSMTGDNSITTHWRVAKGGVTIADSEQIRKIGTVGADVGNAGLHAEVTLATGEYLEVWHTTEAGEDLKDITAVKMTMTVE